MRIKPIKSKNIDISLSAAPDKSITHRAIMFNSIADISSFPPNGCVIKDALLGDDCLATIECMRALGAEIKAGGGEVRILRPIDPSAVKGKSFKLYAGNSGTTFRLLCGLLAGLGVYAELSGDASIAKRPMERVAAPLRQMGADIKTTDGRAPVFISPAKLRGGRIDIETPSAQVKSAVILAALRAEGATVIKERAVTRDHTELMLKSMGADITATAHCAGTPSPMTISIKPSTVRAADIAVGGDISSAAYWLVLGAIIPGAKITVKRVNINPTRTGIITVMRLAGCGVAFSDVAEAGGEPVADITVEYTAGLKPFEISGGIVPLLIDEIPVLAALACFIRGKSVIKNAAELKVKESDRIETTVSGLRALGADVTAEADGMVIDGTGGLEGASSVIKTCGDHRIAMSMAIAALGSKTGADIDGMECCAVSFPQFLDELEKITQGGGGVVSVGLLFDTTPPPPCVAKRYALIGRDIGYSASQRIHDAIFAALKLDGEYGIIDADESFIAGLRENMKGCAGFNVTKPYKTAVIPHLDMLDVSASRCGAVNTVAVRDGKLKGYNTDGAGFLDSLKYHRVNLKDKRILILGAGGAARAVAAALLNSRYKFASLFVYNRTAENALPLKKGLGRGSRGVEILESLSADYETDVVINCTTAGQNGDICPLPDGFNYKRLSCCIDLIYSPKQTILLRNAAAAGVKTANGAAMLAFQAVRAQKLWQGEFTLTKKAINDIIKFI